MSTPCPPQTKLTDLPEVLQRHIFSFLSDEQRHPPIKISLDYANILTTLLPQPLLALAQASPQLSAVAADLLGPRAAYLTAEVAKKQLPQWITALAPYVKAVSTYDSLVEWLECEAYPQFRDDRFYRQLAADTLHVFRALSGDIAGLEVLDVRNAPFDNCPNFADDLLNGFVSVLERNSPSLRELAVPATGLCAIAIEMVSLKRLDVVELESRNVTGRPRAFSGEPLQPGEEFLPLLRALDGHADRSRNLNTLRELRLKNVTRAPCVDISKSGCRPDFFRAIRSLRLEIANWLKHVCDSTVTFVTLFPNLESLDWTGEIPLGRLHVINSSCTNIQALHLRPYSSSASSTCFPSFPASTLAEIVLATQGKMRTIVVKGKLSSSQMRALGESSPALECLEMQIARDNVGGLVPLLGKHCREMRRLHLSVNARCIRDDLWLTFTRAVQGASDTLCEVILQAKNRNIPFQTAISPMVQSMVHVFEFLGERARIVKYQIPTDLEDVNILADAVCGMLRTCAIHARGLEYLEANFIPPNHYYRTRAVRNELRQKLLKEKEKVLDTLPHLHAINLGLLDR